jgi:hypothetical protein
MSLLNNSIIFSGIIILLVGFWYYAKSTGENECNPPAGKASTNSGGGIAGMVIGSALLGYGLYLNLSAPGADIPEVTEATVPSSGTIA